MSTQLIFGNTIHISNMIFIAIGKNRQTNLFGHTGQLMGKAERGEVREMGKWHGESGSVSQTS